MRSGGHDEDLGAFSPPDPPRRRPIRDAVSIWAGQSAAEQLASVAVAIAAAGVVASLIGLFGAVPTVLVVAWIIVPAAILVARKRGGRP